MGFTEQNTDNLISKAHPDGIYELIMLQSKRKTVDEWIDCVNEIWEMHNTNRQPIPILSDNTQADNLPLSYAFREGMKLTRQYNNLPKGRTAFIVKKSTLTKIMNSFLRMMPLNIEFRYFSIDERAEAISWLKEFTQTEPADSKLDL
jgi:hypothetical protein